MMKMVAIVAMRARNFVASSQDFHIELLKSAINLKNSWICDIQARIISKRKISGINLGEGVCELPSENGSLPFKTGELERIFIGNKEGSKSQMKRYKTSWVYQFDPIF